MSDPFQQLRKRRMKIMQQLPPSNKQRLSSAQRRRKIESNIDQFRKTMHSNFYAASPSKSKENQGRANRTISQFFKKQNDMQSPSVKDIIQRQSSNQSERIQTARFDDESNSKKQISMKKRQVQDALIETQMIKSEQSQRKHERQQESQQQRSLKDKQNQNYVPINATKFQNFTIQNQNQDVSDQIAEDIKRQYDQHKNNDDKNQNLDFMLSQSSQQRHSTPNPSTIQKMHSIQKKEGQNIEHPSIADKSEVSQSNTSSAIFFTSQFQEYINQAHKTIQTIDNNNKKQEKIQNEQLRPRKQDHKGLNLQLSNHLNTISQQGNKQQKKQDGINRQNKYFEQPQHARISNSASQQLILSQSKSGRSFALSNEESLKYSMNQSAVNQLIHKKLGPQLFLDRQSFYKDQNNIKSFADRTHRHWRNSHFKDFYDFAKIYCLHRFQQKVQMRMGFQELQVVNYLAEQQEKYNAFAQIFHKRRNQKLKRYIFEQMKHQTLRPKVLADKFKQEKDEILLNNTFRVLKMYWYDRKIIAQIDRYYLNKIFNHLKLATKKQAKRQNKKALKFYYKNALKRYFNLFVQGVYNTRNQKQKVMAAYDHYALTLMLKCFGAWKQRISSKGGKYISLAMTTKDVFKQTADHRWIQTKTLDFKYIK